MKAAHMVILAPLFIMAACAQVKNDGATLKSLEHKSVVVEKDVTIDGSREKAKETYQSILESPNNQIVQREAMRKLADLSAEEAELIVSDKFDQADKQTPQVDGVSQNTLAAGVTPGADSQAAIKLYENLLKNNSNSAKDEDILYQLAKAYEQSGDYGKTLEALTKFSLRYPKAAYIDEVYFRKGEILFTLKDYAEAEKAYQKILAWKKSQFYEIATYKYGWSLYKQDKYVEALDAFFIILDKKISPKNVLADNFYASRSEQEFIKDTLHVVSLCFYHMNGADSIGSYLAKKGARPYDFLIYRQLGDLNISKERLNNAVDSYRAFIKSTPGYPQTVLLQQKIIDAYKKPEFSNLRLQEKEEFMKVYRQYEERLTGPIPKSYSEHIMFKDPKARGNIVAFLKENIEDLARYYHADAQQTKQKNAYKKAISWYLELINNFKDGAHIPGITFLLGEALYENGQYAEAVIRYEEVAYSLAVNSYGAEAGYAALLAYQQHEKKLSGYEQSVWRRNGIMSALRFSERYPKDARVPALLTTATEELFSLKQYDKAEYAARLILKAGEKIEKKLRQRASIIIAHSDFERELFDKAEAGYVEVLGFLPVDAKERNDIVEHLAASIYKQGEKLRALDKVEEAIAHFLRVAKLTPGSSIRTTADYEAALGYMTLRDWKNASRLFSDFQKTHPDHPLLPDISKQLANIYLELDQPLQAAAELEKIMLSNKDAPLRQEAAWQAAGMYEKANEPASAMRLYERYIELFPSPLEQAIEARLKLSDIHNKNNNVKMRDYWLQEIIKADRLGGDERTDRTRLMAAKVIFSMAEPVHKAFTDTRLVEPLQKSLVLKKEKMELALQAYNLAAESGVAEIATAATYQSAKIYSDFGRALMDSQRPEGLSPDELDQYNLLLEEQVFPFEEKAIQIHELNAQRALKGVYDDSVRLSFTELGRLLPGRYGKFEKSEGFVFAGAIANTVTDPMGNKSSEEKEAQERSLLKVVELNPGRAEGYNQMGIFYRHTGRFEDARKMYERALNIDPGYQSARYNLGILYDLYLANIPMALENYKKYLAMASSEDKQVSLWIADLEKRHKSVQKVAESKP